MIKLLADFVGLFFPSFCLGCMAPLVAGEDTLCTECLMDLPRIEYLGTSNSVSMKLTGRLPIKSGFAFLTFRKGGMVQNLLHQLKYNNHPEVGVKLGKVFGKQLADEGYRESFDVIVPVPLHPSRLRKRGYNQSAKIAEGLSQTLQVPWDNSTSVRTGRTSTQTHRTRVDRWENVKNVFSIKNPDRIRNKRVLLVDDVITTGATVEACGRALLEGGCRELSVACIAEA